MKSKLKNSGGVSVVEMLCAVLMLTLLCLLMNTGLQSAVRSYREVTAVSEARLLLSSLSDALSDKLRYAVVTKNADGTFSYSIGEIKSDDKGMVVVEEKNADGTTKESKPLLPGGAYGNGRYKAEVAVEANADASGDTVTFKVKLTVEEEPDEIRASTELEIRCLNPLKTE